MPASPPRHLVTVWNPSYAHDAMNAHLDVLLRWAERADGNAHIPPNDVYVWWAKVRSSNRMNPLPHGADILALDAQCQGGEETHLYLTDYRSLYVGQLGEITADDVLKDTPDEREHAPAYYEGLAVDFWFRLFDIRRLVANDTVAVIAQLRALRNTRYHDRPVSLYGGMAELPLIVTRGDGVQWFTDRDALTDGRLWASRDAHLRGETERTAADLRDNVLGTTVWAALEPGSRTFLATGEAMFRAHREDPRFDFSSPAVEYAKAVEVELNAILFPALRRALSRATPAERSVNLDNRPADLAGHVTHQSLGALRGLLKHESIVRKALETVARQDWQWLTGELPASLDTLVDTRNPAAHSGALTRDTVITLRDSTVGVGQEGLIARLARAKLRIAK